MINRTVLVGRLTKDIELRHTATGIPYARFTLAVNRTFTGQNGEKDADFISCLAWRKQAENLAQFMKKGSLIGIEGRIQTSSFEGSDGKRVYMTDVVADSVQFLEPRGTSNSTQNSQNQSFGDNQNYGGQPSYNNQPNQQFGRGQQDNSFGGGYQQPAQNNYSRNEGAFANNNGPIDVNDDDLPF